MSYPKSQNTIRLLFLSSAKEIGSFYELRNELTVRKISASIQEIREDDFSTELGVGMPAPGVGADIPEFIKTAFLSPIVALVYVSLGLIAKGFFTEIGKESYKKVKEILRRIIISNRKGKSKKDLDSLGVVVKVIDKQTQKQDLLWFFFLDGVSEKNTLDSLAKISGAIYQTKRNFDPEFLNKIWKIGFKFNNKTRQWMLLDVQEHPQWLLGKVGEPQGKKFQQEIGGKKEGNHKPKKKVTKKVESLTVADLQEEIQLLMKQLTDLQGQIDGSTNDNLIEGRKINKNRRIN